MLGAKPASVYADAENWAYAETDVTDKAADVFFVAPTVYLGTEEKLSWDSYDEKAKTSFVGAVNMEKGIYDDDARLPLSPIADCAGERCCCRFPRKTCHEAGQSAPHGCIISKSPAIFQNFHRQRSTVLCRT